MGDFNYLQIQKWMIDKLGLSGNELIIFATIYGFSQDGASVFHGSLKYLMGWASCSKSTALRALSKLIDEEYVIKHENIVGGVTLVSYSINKEGVVSKLHGGCQNETGGGVKMTPNDNIDIYTSNSIPFFNVPPLKPKKKDEPKKEFAEGVNIRQSEYDTLVKKYGEEDTRGIIKWFSVYRKDKGYKNKDDYSAITRWVAKAYFKDKEEAERAKARESKPKGLMSTYQGVFEMINGKGYGREDNDIDDQSTELPSFF